MDAILFPGRPRPGKRIASIGRRLEAIKYKKSRNIIKKEIISKMLIPRPDYIQEVIGLFVEM